MKTKSSCLLEFSEFLIAQLTHTPSQIHTSSDPHTLTHSHLHTLTLHTPSQNEDLAALAAQQYYVEMGAQMNPERLMRMLPTVIPDSCLAGSGMADRWKTMVINSYSRVSAAEAGHITMQRVLYKWGGGVECVIYMGGG